MLESLLGSHRLPIVKTNDALDICIFESFLLTLHFAFLFLYSVFKVPSDIPPRFLSGGLKNDEVILPWGGCAPRVVGSSGLEPPTSRLSGVRSNHLSYEPISVAELRGILTSRPTMVEMNRIELSTPCLQGRCSPS